MGKMTGCQAIRAKIFVCLLVLLAVSTVSAMGQEVPMPSSLGPLPAAPNDASIIVGQSSHHALSAPLRDLPVETPEQMKSAKFIMRPRHYPLVPPVQSRLNPQLDSVVQPFVGINLLANPTLNFDGLGQGVFGFIPPTVPPDTSGAVGATQFVQWVNLSFVVLSKVDGHLIAGPFAGNTLWHGFGGDCENRNDGDPIVQYDKLANRWVLTQFTVPDVPPFMQCIAVSTSSDATGTWNLYSFVMTSINLQGNVVGAFGDFPKLGVWPEAYYMGFRM